MSTTRKVKILCHHAIFQPAPEGGFGVSFPDLPGCLTFGKTFEEARDNAKEVLALWLEELAENKIVIPVRPSHRIIDEISTLVPKRARLSYEAANH